MQCLITKLIKTTDGEMPTIQHVALLCYLRVHSMLLTTRVA